MNIVEDYHRDIEPNSPMQIGTQHSEEISSVIATNRATYNKVKPMPESARKQIIP